MRHVISTVETRNGHTVPFRKSHKKDDTFISATNSFRYSIYKSQLCIVERPFRAITYNKMNPLRNSELSRSLLLEEACCTFRLLQYCTTCTQAAVHGTQGLKTKLWNGIKHLHSSRNLRKGAFTTLHGRQLSLRNDKVIRFHHWESHSW